MSTENEILKLKVSQDKFEYINKNIPYIYQKDMTDLAFKLLSYSGHKVVLPDMEYDLENLLKYGKILKGEDYILIKGQICQCHRNSIKYWYENKTICKFMTGYAMGKDGVWRQHSWCIQKNKIIETTKARLCYFGITYSYNKSIKFYKKYFNLNV